MPDLARRALRSTCFVLAFSLCVPASAAGADYFLKLDGVEGGSKGKHDHKDEIEILSYSFGPSQAARVSKIDSFTIKQKAVEGTDGNGKVDARTDGLLIVRNSAASGGEKGGTEDINIGVGELRESRGGVSVAAGDVTGDGRSAASGLPTGKRQHKPMVVTKPLDKGSIKLAGSVAPCAVGKTYPLIEVGGRGRGYKLRNVQVVSCGKGTMTANYDGLIIVRY